VDGVRSYARVRAGDEVKLQPRPVTVYEFELRETRRLTAEGLIDLDVRVACSSGTYIRALARDLGEGLGVGGHLTALRRTRVGPYTLAEAESLTELMALYEAGGVIPVLPIAEAAGAAFPRYDADEEQAKAIAHGGPLPARGLGPGPIAVFAPDGTFLALVEEQGRRCKPIAVFV
jgi:tRNA pseudouridine55 synthase